MAVCLHVLMSIYQLAVPGLASRFHPYSGIAKSLGYFPATLHTGTMSACMLLLYVTHRRLSVEVQGVAKISISAFPTVVRGFELQ